MVGHTTFRYTDAVFRNGQCICHANEHVGGHCGDGESHGGQRWTRREFERMRGQSYSRTGKNNILN